jgi:hypothetical protein
VSFLWRGEGGAKRGVQRGGRHKVGKVMNYGVDADHDDDDDDDDELGIHI